MHPYKYIIKASSVFKLILICLLFFVKVNLIGNTDSLLAFFNYKNLIIDERVRLATSSSSYKELTKSEHLFLSFLVRANQWYQTDKNMDKLYYLTRLKCNLLIEKNRVGDLFVTVDQFKQQAEIKNNKEDIIRSFILYDRAYANFDLFEEWAETSKQLYHLRKQDTSFLKRIDNLGSYCWTLNNCAFYLKQKNLYDSCLIYYEILNKTLKKGIVPWNVQIEIYSTYILVLKRLKEYQKVHTVTLEALQFCNTTLPEGDAKKHALADFYRSYSQSKFYLQQIDSAFYYANISKKLDEKNSLSISEGPIFYLVYLKKYKEAANALYPYVFGEKKKQLAEPFGWFCGKFANVFEKAGKLTEANYCYRVYKNYADSITKVNQEKTNEYDKTKTLLLIASERKSAQLASEKVELKYNRDKEQKNLIIIAGLVFILIIIIFFFIVYKRYKFIKKQNFIIESQKKELKDKNLIIEEKQKEIIDSIKYAKRIQEAHLPTEKYLNLKIRK